MSDTLRQAIRRADPYARLVPEIVAVDAETLKRTQDDMNGADSLTGLIVRGDGGVQLAETGATVLDQSTVTGSAYISALTSSSPIICARVILADSYSAAVEILSITARLAPANGGSQQVQQWVCQLYGTVSESYQSGAHVSPTTLLQLVPLGPPAKKTATTSEGDVVFSWTSAVKPQPKSVSFPIQTSHRESDLYVVIYGITSMGAIASHVGWAVDTGHGSYSEHNDMLTQVTLTQTTDPNAWTSRAKPVPGSGWYSRSAAATQVPRLKIVYNTGTVATITFSGLENQVELPTNEIENATYEIDDAGTEPVSGSIPPATLVRDNAHAHTGTWSMKVTTANHDYSGIRPIRNAGPTFPYELFPVDARKSYEFRAWVYGTGSGIGKTMVLGISWRDAADTVLANIEQGFTLVSGWQEVVVSGAADGRATYAALYCAQTPAQGVWDFWFDDPWFAASLTATTLEFVGVGETPQGSSLTYEVKADDGTWIAFIDGDTTVTLSAANPTHPISIRDPAVYAMRATLTPTSAGDGTPTLRMLGARFITAYSLAQVATFTGGTARVDPVSGKATIAQGTLRAIQDGERDFRALITSIISQYAYRDLALRLWWGGDRIDRASWMLHSLWLMDDHQCLGGALELTLVSPLVLLRGVLPTVDIASGLRSPLVFTGVTCAAAWSEILRGQLGLEERFIGDGPDDPSSLTVSKTIPANRHTEVPRPGSLVQALLDQQGWQTVQARDEVDAVSWIAGGATVEVQGRIQWVPLVRGDVVDLPDTSRTFQFTPDAVRLVLDDQEIEWSDVGPGSSQAVPEYYAPYNWNYDAQQFDNQYRGFNAPALLNRSRSRLDAEPILETGVAQWLDETAAERVAVRQVVALGGGLLALRFRTGYAYPELTIGDLVAIRTERFAAFDPIAARALAGSLWVLAVIVGCSPDGQTHECWVRQWSDITPAASITGVTAGRDAPATFDVMRNGGFEDGLEYWYGSGLGISGQGLTCEIEEASPYAGTRSLKITHDRSLGGDGKTLGQGVGSTPLYTKVVPGETLHIRFAAKTDDATLEVSFGMSEFTDTKAPNGGSLLGSVNSAGWTIYETDITVASDTYYVQPALYFFRSSGTIAHAWVDECYIFRSGA